MSDYHILHERKDGFDKWTVYYKGTPLRYMLDSEGSVVSNGSMSSVPCRSIDEAKKIIESHTKYVNGDVIEWLDREGNPLNDVAQNKQKKAIKTWLFVSAILIIVFILTT